MNVSRVCQVDYFPFVHMWSLQALLQALQVYHVLVELTPVEKKSDCEFWIVLIFGEIKGLKYFMRSNFLYIIQTTVLEGQTTWNTLKSVNFNSHLTEYFEISVDSCKTPATIASKSMNIEFRQFSFTVGFARDFSKCYFGHLTWFYGHCGLVAVSFQ